MQDTLQWYMADIFLAKPMERCCWTIRIHKCYLYVHILVSLMRPVHDLPLQQIPATYFLISQSFNSSFVTGRFESLGSGKSTASNDGSLPEIFLSGSFFLSWHIAVMASHACNRLCIQELHLLLLDVRSQQGLMSVIQNPVQSFCKKHILRYGLKSMGVYNIL